MSYFPRTSAEINAAEMRPAIIQQAKKDWKYYQQAIIACEERTGELLKQYKESGVWKQQYKTWTDACVPLNISRSQANRLIAEENDALCATESPTQDKQKTLDKIAKLPVQEEEPERPRVKTARESIADAVYMEREEAKQVPLECPKCLGSGWIGAKPKEVSEPCKCGCDLTVNVCQTLAEHGVPSIGLTTGQAGLLMGKIKANEWKLPRAFDFAKNEGEWVERKFKGKPAPKTP